MKRPSSIYKTQSGLTLIEMLVAMMLGAFLLGTVMQTFLAARQSYRTQEGLSRLIENGRYALEFLERDVRMAGFRGCNSNLSLAGTNNHLTSPTSYLNSFDTAIWGFESTSSSAWSPAVDASISSPDGGHDIITIRRADENGDSVTAHAAPANDVTLNDTSGLAVNKNALIADCSHAEVFSITNITNNNVSHGPTLINTYPNGEMFPIHTTSFYIRMTKDGVASTDATCFQSPRPSSCVPTLYRSIDATASQLIEGVENMQIYYGEDTDLDPTTGRSTDYTANYYVPANSVVNMRRVISVQLKLLIATPDDHVTAEPAAWSFDGTAHAADTAPDHRIRREFVSTIALRNRFN